MKTISKAILIAVVLATSTSCQNTKVYELNNVLDAKKAKRLIQEGPNTIKGSALIRQQGGNVVHCGGNKIRLIPVTAHASERMRHLYGSTQSGFRSASSPQAKFTPIVLHYDKLQRSTTCNSQGKFKFENVANGEFFLTTRVVWRVPYGSYQGGNLMKRVKVSGGETKDVVLSP